MPKIGDIFFSAVFNLAPTFIIGLGHEWWWLESGVDDCLDVKGMIGSAGSASSTAVAGTDLATTKDPEMLDEKADTTVAPLIPDTSDVTSAATTAFLK